MQECGQSGRGGLWSVHRFDKNMQNGGCGQTMGGWSIVQEVKNAGVKV